jgi:hypothetical protein
MDNNNVILLNAELNFIKYYENELKKLYNTLKDNNIISKSSKAYYFKKYNDGKYKTSSKQSNLYSCNQIYENYIIDKDEFEKYNLLVQKYSEYFIDGNNHIHRIPPIKFELYNLIRPFDEENITTYRIYKLIIRYFIDNS